MTAADLRDRVDAALSDFLAAAIPRVTAISTDLDELAEAVTRFVLDGGKRLRPAFCYWGYRATGASDRDDIVRAAAALELLHAGALMHDDVIDASDTRRGAPAVHRRFADVHEEARWSGDKERFGAAAAILIGDLALIWADAMLTSSGFTGDALHRAWPVWDAMRVEVMCGQFLDVVEQSRGGGSVTRALRVARFKTAKYTVERPLQLGAALGGGDDGLSTALGEFGLPLGEAFQLRDDVLGVFGDPRTTGKPAGDDVREGKRTVLVAFASESATSQQRARLDACLGDAALDDSGVEDVRAIIRDTGALRRVEELISSRTDEALLALESTPMDAAARNALRCLAIAAAQRTG